ncbi:MAG: Rrf2 family transcriptional regulator [Eubacteriales bacterium]|nr:Rrf2 family transcriptional regulator [Eubacteriales bacterium]
MHISMKCSIAIHCLIFVYEYGEEQKVTSHLLSLSTGVNPVTIRNILSALKKAGLVSVKFGTGGTTLNCPLDEISLYRIYTAIEPGFAEKLIGIHASPAEGCPVGRNIHCVLDRSYQKIQNDLCDSLKKITLKDVVSDYHKLLSD